MNWVIRVLQTHALPLGYVAIYILYFIKDELIRQDKNDSYGNRTLVTAVKGRCLNRLTKEPYLYALLGIRSGKFAVLDYTIIFIGIMQAVFLKLIKKLLSNFLKLQIFLSGIYRPAVV